MKKILFVSLAALLAFAGCVKDEVYKGPSTIEKVVFSPEAPTSIADVTGGEAPYSWNTVDTHCDHFIFSLL